MSLTVEQAKVIRALADAIIDAVKASGPTGAPGGAIYAALMTSGCPLEFYQSLMEALVKAGKLQRRGECYFLPQPAREFV